MRNSVVLKFIAIVLCAVCLLGTIASALGIFAMAEGNLYSKTVDALIDDQIQQTGAQIAHSYAARYASITLGGTPEVLADRLFPYYSGALRSYAYVLKDADGNILESSSLEGFETADVYAFPVSGQYVHTTSLLTVAQKYPSYQGMNPENLVQTRIGDAYLYSAVPPEGAVIGQLYFITQDGSSYDYVSSGTVHFDRSGNVICQLTETHLNIPHNTTVTEIILFGSDGTMLYQTSCPSGVGYFTHSSDLTPMFVSTLEGELLAQPAPAMEPEPVSETVPEATEETVPETTAETVPETTVPETEFRLEDNLPEKNSTEVTRMKITFLDETVYEHTDAQGIGRVQRENNAVTFASYDPLDGPETAAEASHVCFWGKEDTLLLEAYSPDGIGKFSHNDSGRLRYTSDFPVIPVQETVPPETAAETVPETQETIAEETVETFPAETVPETTEVVYINGKSIYEFEINNETYYDHQSDTEMYAEYVYTPMPEYTVELYLNDNSFAHREAYTVLRLVQRNHSYLLPILGVSILGFILLAVYLCFAAGCRSGSDEIRAGGLNRIPLDLYLILAIFGIAGLVAAAAGGGYYLMQANLLLGIVCALGCAFAACVLAVGFLFAMVAQIKTPGCFWWHNSLCGSTLRWFLAFMKWFENFLGNRFFPFCERLIKRLWKLTVSASLWTYRTCEGITLWFTATLGRFFRWSGKKLHRFLSLLPLTWQWLSCGFLIFLLVSITAAANGEEVLVLLCFWVSICLIVYGAHCFGVLLERTKKMGKGDLDTKVDDKLMVGAFKDFAAELNNLADVVEVAAQKQLKSERMKTELVTNVSHDIKTPLTSIINYVDLLQKPHTEAEKQQYLEVLERQSLRLKKLIDDLMEMSKASTGNMSVEITQVDAVEAINQALGEFGGKLEQAQLIPVFRHSEIAVPMLADGRLVWRVMSNLLSNAVKYAMPGTRLYIDLSRVEGNVVVSLKNISREELHMDPQDLMERFVRGDDSRNTEGSGLGLNIAQSLMQLQKGSLQILVDGDLFKVTLTFPGVE